MRSVDDYITGVARDKLTVFSHLHSPFVQGVDPKSLPFDHDGPAIGRGKALKDGLGSLVVFGHFDIGLSDDSNLQFFFRRGRETGLSRRVGWAGPWRQRSPDFDSSLDPRRICPHPRLLEGRGRH